MKNPLCSHPQRGGHGWKTLLHQIRMALRIEGGLLGWSVSSFLGGHTIPVRGKRTGRLGRSEDRKLPAKLHSTKGSAPSLSSRLKAGSRAWVLPVLQSHDGRRWLKRLPRHHEGLPFPFL